MVHGPAKSGQQATVIKGSSLDAKQAQVGCELDCVSYLCSSLSYPLSIP